eukprot:6676372-Alexandrium_andersonii.AAC.1
MSASLVGSEMCIRDSLRPMALRCCWKLRPPCYCASSVPAPFALARPTWTCLLYTSDAADDM